MFKVSSAGEQVAAKPVLLLVFLHDGRVELYAWLRNTLEKFAAGHPMSRIHDLLP